MPGQSFLGRLAQRLGLVNINRHPWAVEIIRQSPRPADHLLRKGTGAYGDQEAMPGFPGAGDLHRLQIIMHVLPDMIGSQTQGHFPQGGQVAFAEKIHHGQLGPLRHIDLALVQPLQKFFGRQVDQLHFGAVKHTVGNRLLHRRAGDLPDSIHPAFGVLHIHRRININTRIEQFDHILVAFGVSGAGDVGVGQFVNQRQLRVPREQRVQIHFLQRNSSVVHFAPGNNGQAIEKGFRLLAAMRFHVTHDDVNAFALGALPCAQHCICFADAGGHAKKHLELAAFLFRLTLLDGGQQGIGIWTHVLSHGW